MYDRKSSGYRKEASLPNFKMAASMIARLSEQASALVILELYGCKLEIHTLFHSTTKTTSPVVNIMNSVAPIYCNCHYISTKHSLIYIFQFDRQ